jgi:HK97 family phage prohead protease
MLTKVLLKNQTGEMEEKSLTFNQLTEWFKSHTDKAGNVNDDIVIFNTGTIKQKTNKEKQELFEFVFSDYTLDRDQERVDPAGAKLENFKKNPVILWGHDYRIPAIGISEDVRYESDAIIGSIMFDDLDEFAVKIKNKVAQRILRSVSIGFMPRRIEIVEDRERPERLIHREWELFEASIINVPSNTNAVRREIPETLPGDIGKDIAERMDAKLRSIFDKGHVKNKADGSDTSKAINTAQTIKDYLK